MLDLEPIKQRLAVASEGPWTSDSQYIATGEPAPLVSGPCAGVDGVVRLADCGTTWRTNEETLANATFIAHAQTDVPALLAEVEQLHGLFRQFVDSVAGEQEDPDELARALGREAARLLPTVRAALGDK